MKSGHLFLNSMILIKLLGTSFYKEILPENLFWALVIRYLEFSIQPFKKTTKLNSLCIPPIIPLNSGIKGVEMFGGCI